MNGRTESIARALGGTRSGAGWLCHCPVSSHGRGRGDRHPSLSIANNGHRLLVHCFGGCDARDVLDELARRNLAVDWPGPSASFSRTNAPSAASMIDPDAHAVAQHQKALALWRRRRPVEGSPVEVYLREVRAYGGPFPPTIGYLPPMRSGHHPAMIAAFGLPDEFEPGALAIRDDAVRGIHLTLLLPDGSGKAATSPNRLMVGSSFGWPIVLSPPNDLLGLFVAEGIESGLSLAEATRSGVWVAGSANRMPALGDRVPDYIDTVTVPAEADRAGRENAGRLFERLTGRNIHCEVITLIGEKKVEAA